VPIRSNRGGADTRRQSCGHPARILLVLEIEGLHRRPEVLAHHLFKPGFPVVAREELDQSAEITL